MLRWICLQLHDTPPVTPWELVLFEINLFILFITLIFVKLIFKKTGTPTRKYLFNARNNILTGSAYLKILRDRYLSKIQHPTSQLYCIISAYNGGAGNVFKTFHSNRKKAIQRINALSVEDVLWRLRKKQPSLEARRYLEKVLANQQKHAA